MYYNVLQCTTMYYNVLQCTTMYYIFIPQKRSKSTILLKNGVLTFLSFLLAYPWVSIDFCQFLPCFSHVFPVAGTAAFIREVARRKLTASAMGLVWPPASSRAGTPKTRQPGGKWGNIDGIYIYMNIWDIYYIYIYIWLCLFFRCADFSKGGKFEFCEPYPRIIPRTIPRIIPANHTPKNHDYECFFWDRLGLHGLTSFNGRDKPIDKCWPDPMIPGCLHIPSRHEW